MGLISRVSSRTYRSIMDNNQKSLNNTFIRETSIGKTLIRTIQETENEGTFEHLSDEQKGYLFHKIMETFDSKLQENLNHINSCNTQGFKVSVKSSHKDSTFKESVLNNKNQPSSIVWYNNSNEEWRLQLKDVEFKPTSGEAIQTEQILIHAFPCKKDLKNKDNNNLNQIDHDI